MTPALRKLRHLYGHRNLAADAWRAKGGRVVGYVGPDVPRELIAAAGMMPMRVTGEGHAVDGIGAELLGASVDGHVLALASRLCAGDANPFDFLVFSHEDEPVARLYASLREMHRLGIHTASPEPYLVDMLHIPSDATAAYDAETVRRFAEQLGDWAGRALKADDLAAAIAVANENRRLLGSVLELRREARPRLGGADALAVIGAGMVMETREHNAVLRELLAESDGLSQQEPSPRVYLTGSDHETALVYDAMESLGAMVVGEDHDWGERSGDGFVVENNDPIEAIASHYHVGSATGRRHDTIARARHAADQARRAKADLVLSWIRDRDDAHAWHVPAQRELLNEAGIPFAVLRHQPYRPQSVAAVADSLKALLALDRAI